MGSSTESSVPVLFFLFFGLLVGAIVTYVLSRCQGSSLPYTVTIFLIGIAFGCMANADGSDSIFTQSILSWVNIRPELILFVFLPALLFSEVKNLDFYHFRGSLFQACWLAGPAALMGAALLACVMDWDMLPFPVHWSTNVSFLFSSILCATDTVAVVQLLNETNGGSHRMKYMIIGESLLNDATALILFHIFMPREVIGEVPMTNIEIMMYIIKILFLSPIVGCGIGALAVYATNLASRVYLEEDRVIQTAIPVCCAYLSFFVGDHLMEISGVLCCFFSGLVFCYLTPSLFVQSNWLHGLWSALEWSCNTMIFLLAGLVISTKSIQYITGEDVLNVIIIYIWIFLIRGAVLVVSFPLMANIGKGCSAAEAAFATFGGLRGAIGVSLILSLNQQVHHGMTTISMETSHKMVFYVGGVAGLSLLLNAPLGEMVLEKLGLVAKKAEHKRDVEIVMYYAMKRVRESVVSLILQLPEHHLTMLEGACNFIRRPKSREDQNKEIRAFNNALFSASHEDQTATAAAVDNSIQSPASEIPPFAGGSVVSPLHVPSSAMPIGDSSPRALSERSAANYDALDVDVENPDLERHGADLLETASEKPVTCGSFRMSDINPELMRHVRHSFLDVVRTYYWKCVHAGLLSRHSSATRTLMTSIEEALEQVEQPGLHDFDFILESFMDPLLVLLDYGLPWLRSKSLMGNRVYVLTAFIAGHKRAQSKITLYFGENDTVDTPEQFLVIHESKQQVERASKLLDQLDPEMIELQRSKQLARTILYVQENVIIQQFNEGVINKNETDNLLESLHRDSVGLEVVYAKETSRIAERRGRTNNGRIVLSQSGEITFEPVQNTMIPWDPLNIMKL